MKRAGMGYRRRERGRIRWGVGIVPMERMEEVLERYHLYKQIQSHGFLHALVYIIYFALLLS